MVTSHYRGHKILCLFQDTKQPVSSNKDCPCGRCGKPSTKDGHDGCIGTLKSVINACCGHGVIGEAYVQFVDKSRVSGKEALEIIQILKKERN